MDEQDRQLLLQTFAAEVEENLAAFEQGLVALEARPDDAERLNAVFRVAHTLKGAAATVGLRGLAEVAHALEELLERMREKAVPVDVPRVTLLLQAADLLRETAARALAGEAQPPPAPLMARLAAAAQGAQAELATPSGAEIVGGARARAGRTLRVDVERLDRMLDLSGEIAIARGRLTELLERGSASREAALEAHREADRLYLDLQELIMKVRMVPVGPLFLQQLRTVRDLAVAAGKKVRLVIEGDDVELDTSMMERVRDPLIHLVRNAVAHGIEAPEQRRAKGKEPTGRVLLQAFHEGSSIAIRVRDDGRGLDRARILEVARARGLLPAGASPGDEELAQLIFHPGFTTAGQVTELSGRGVGMDVVRKNVEALRGTVAVESAEGEGTAVTLRLPLTLAIIQGFGVAVGDEAFVLPLDSVIECVEIPQDERRPDAHSGILNLRGGALPFVRLREFLGVPGAPPSRESVVVVRHGDALAGLAVDSLLGESQVVVKPLGHLFREVPGVSGCTIFGSGRIALILDVPVILAAAVERGSAAASSTPSEAGAHEAPPPPLP